MRRHRYAQLPWATCRQRALDVPLAHSVVVQPQAAVACQTSAVSTREASTETPEDMRARRLARWQATLQNASRVLQRVVAHNLGASASASARSKSRRSMDGGSGGVGAATGNNDAAADGPIKMKVVVVDVVVPSSGSMLVTVGTA